jgi:hypothetical protein
MGAVSSQPSAFNKFSTKQISASHLFVILVLSKYADYSKKRQRARS